MPQMAPLNWLTLYLIFILITMMFLAQNYFTKIESLNKEKTTFNKISKTWKW